MDNKDHSVDAARYAGLSDISKHGEIKIEPMKWTYKCDKCGKEVECGAWHCEILHIFDKKICKECTMKIFGLEKEKDVEEPNKYQNCIY